MKFQTGVSKFQFNISVSTSKFPIRVLKLGECMNRLDCKSVFIHQFLSVVFLFSLLTGELESGLPKSLIPSVKLAKIKREHASKLTLPPIATLYPESRDP